MFEFVETAPVIRPGGPGPGRKPSPFEEPVRSLIGQTVKVDGKDRPKTLQFVIDTVDPKEILKVRGQVQSMGKRMDPEVSVHTTSTPETKEVRGKGTVPTGKTVVKFWVTEKIHRTRKPKTATPAAESAETK